MQIVKLLQKGVSIPEIATQLEVSEALVQRITKEWNEE
ncbi:MAG: helix-turn-helix domain-containing protein [Bacteroidota bacterium]